MAFFIKNIFVFGSTGMAGHVITRYLINLNKYDVINCSRSRLDDNTIILDVFNRQSVKKVLKNVKPDIIINCIGLLIEESNDFPDRAIYINSYFPHYLVKLGSEIGFKLIHLSTDCVFSGKKGGYTEQDIPDGKDFYARSKALGEIINRKDLTIRTSIIGPELKKDGVGLFQWFMTQTGKVFGYKNVYWTGITTLELAKSIDDAIEQNLSSLYHLVPNMKISKYNLLKLINKVWNKKILILEDTEHVSDRSLINNRKDFHHKIPSYKEMLTQLRSWMKEAKYVNYNKYYTINC